MTVIIDGEAGDAEVHAIGISFGNSNSSIAYTTGVRDDPCSLPFTLVLTALM